MLLLVGYVGEKKRVANIGPDVVIEILTIKHNRVLFSVATDAKMPMPEPQIAMPDQEEK
jgi:hypothetical protein